MDFPGWCHRVADVANKRWDNKLLLSLPNRYDCMDWQRPAKIYR